MKRWLAMVLLVGVWCAVRIQPVWADDGTQGKVVLGGNFTLASGEVIAGDLVVLGGTVTLESGSVVQGNTVVLGGTVDIAGTIQQDLTMIGGHARLLDTAVIQGMLSTAGGLVERETGAQIRGGENQGFSITRPSAAAEPTGPWPAILNLVGGIVWAGVASVLASLLALALMALLPEQSGRVSAALTAAPWEAGLLGFLSLVAVPVVLTLILVTICLSPITLIGGIVYGAALLFGWVGLGLALGTRTAQVLKRSTLSPVLWGVGGTFVLTLTVNLLGVLARLGDLVANYGGWWVSLTLTCMNILLPLSLASLGLGGVILTRFGSQPFVKTRGGSAPAPAAPTHLSSPLVPGSPSAGPAENPAPEEPGSPA